MTTKLKTIWAETGDWVAVYDTGTGRLVHQGHSVDWVVIASYLDAVVDDGGDAACVDGMYADRFPSTLAELEKLEEDFKSKE